MNKKRSLMRSIAAAPHIFWAILFIVLPLIIVVYYAFTDADGNFSFENITALGEYGQIFWLSLELSIIATAICLLVGYPLAYIIARAKPKHQKLFIDLRRLGQGIEATFVDAGGNQIIARTLGGGLDHHGSFNLVESVFVIVLSGNTRNIMAHFDILLQFGTSQI